MKVLSRILGYGFALVVFLGICVWIFSPMITRSVVGGILQEQGLILDEESSVRLNPFFSHLTIYDLAWQAKDGTVFHLDALSIKYSLLPLLLSKVHVSEIDIQGVNAKLAQNKKGLTVVGFQLASPEEQPVTAAGENAQTTESEPETSSGPLQVSIELDALRLSDIRVDMDIEGQQQQVVINALSLDEIEFDGEHFSGYAATQISLNPELQAQFPITKEPTEIQPDSEQGDLPNVSLNLALKALFNGNISDIIDVNLDSIELALTEFKLSDGTHYAKLDALELTIPEVVSSISDATSLTTALTLKLSGVDVTHKDGTQLVSLGAIDLPEVDVELSGNILKSQIERIDISAAKFLSSATSGDISAKNRGPNSVDSTENEIKTDTQTSMAGFESLTLQTLSGEFDLNNGPSNITLESVLLDKLLANLAIDAEGNVQGLGFLASDAVNESDADTDINSEANLESNTEKSTESETTSSVSESSNTKANVAEDDAIIAHQNASEAAPAFTFKIGTVALSSPAIINVEDKSVSPVFDKHIEISALSLENINSIEPNEYLTFLMALKDEDYFNHDLSGNARPFKDKIDLALNSEIKELAVHEISPYLNTALGFGVDAGQLDSNVEVNVIENKLDGDIELHLRGASFASNKAKESDEFDMVGQAAIPLNVALNMLKDSDDNIDLTIPLNGDVDDPSFGVQYIIGLVVKKAVMDQAKTHLINTFIPYGQILSVAYSAGSYALKVRFEDLPYASKQTEITEAHSEFVEQFVTLLNSKEDLQVRLCPVATIRELTAPIEGEKLSEEQNRQLVELAKKRGAAFKKAVTQKGIASKRLLVCSPEIDFNQEALPRISFET